MTGILKRGPGTRLGPCESKVRDESRAATGWELGRRGIKGRKPGALGRSHKDQWRTGLRIGDTRVVQRRVQVETSEPGVLRRLGKAPGPAPLRRHSPRLTQHSASSYFRKQTRAGPRDGPTSALRQSSEPMPRTAAEAPPQLCNPSARGRAGAGLRHLE